MPRRRGPGMDRLVLSMGAVVVLLGATLASSAATSAATSAGNPTNPGAHSGARSAPARSPFGRASTSAIKTAAFTCDGMFNTVSSANGPGVNFLAGISAVNANDAWAVGNSTNAGGYDQTLAEHWDGISWTIVPTPNPGPYHNDFTAVVAISTNDVWAVGAYATSANFSTAIAFAAHWNGVNFQNWYQLQPVPGNQFSVLFGVGASSSSDVWAVGTFYSAGYLPLVYHWDGTGWTRVFLPYPSPIDNELFAVSVFSSTEAWAVGEFTPVGGHHQALAEHLSSGTWTAITAPSSSMNEDNEILGVNALEAGHAVGAGFGYFANGVTPRQSEAWDLLAVGSSTNSTLAGVPGAGMGDNALLGMDRSGTHVEAVGYSRITALAPRQTLAIPATWDPVGHTVTWGAPGASANPGSLNSVLYSAAAVSPYAFMGAGYQNSGGADQTLVESYCGLKFNLTGPAPTYLGTPFSLTVTAQNPNSTTTTGYRGTVHFTSTDPHAVLPSDYTFTSGDAGTHTFSGVALNSLGSQTISAADSVTPFVTASASFTVVCFGACPAPQGTAGARGAGQVPQGTPDVRGPNQSTGAVAGPRLPRFGASSDSAGNAVNPVLVAGAVDAPATDASIAAAPPESVSAIQTKTQVSETRGDRGAIRGAPAAGNLSQPTGGGDWRAVLLMPLMAISFVLLLVRRRNNRKLDG